MQTNTTNSAVQQLEDMARKVSLIPNQRCSVRFTFTPNSDGPYGPEASQWQAVFIRKGNGVIDYGGSIEEAAGRVLDRLQRPEAYPASNDD